MSNKRAFRAACLRDRVKASGIDLAHAEKVIVDDEAIAVKLCNVMLHEYLIDTRTDMGSMMPLLQRAEAIRDVLEPYPMCHGAVHIVWTQYYMKDLVKNFSEREAQALRVAIQV